MVGAGGLGYHHVRLLRDLLETVFAMYGRLRPYNKYLQWELDTAPLPEPWNTALRPARLAGAALTLFPEVEGLARQNGADDVLEAWGPDIDLIRSAALART